MSDQLGLLLIHGLGATGGVWAGVQDELDWPGPVVAPDLPGHGAAPWSGDYSAGALAAAVSSGLVPDHEYVVAGHSLGGAIGVCLASGGFGLTIRCAIGLGIKVSWAEEDVAGMAKVAAKGIRWFESKEAAEERFLLQAGLAGISRSDRSIVASLNGAVTEGDGGWRVSQDPATFAQDALDMSALMAEARCPVVLGAGSEDAMVTEADLAVYVDKPRIAPGKGHNVHVEDPALVVGLIREMTGN